MMNIFKCYVFKALSGFCGSSIFKNVQCTYNILYRGIIPLYFTFSLTLRYLYYIYIFKFIYRGCGNAVNYIFKIIKYKKKNRMPYIKNNSKCSFF